MAWEERTVEQMREEFAKRVLAQEASKAALADRCDAIAYTAQTEEDHVGVGQSLLTIFTPHHFITEKTFVHRIPPEKQGVGISPTPIVLLVGISPQTSYRSPAQC